MSIQIGKVLTQIFNVHSVELTTKRELTLTNLKFRK